MTTQLSAAALINCALGYALNGWRIVPLHTPRAGSCSCNDPSCDHIGKHPRVRDWQRVASISVDMIRSWWRLWPDANIGILTGRTNGLLVLDVDHGGAATLAAHGGAGDTAAVTTGSGGEHYYFTHPGALIPNAVKFLPGLDVRSDGGLVVAPPSIHTSGARYEWKRGFGRPVLPAPAWLLAALAPAPAPANPAGRPAIGPAQGGRSPYALRALRGECDRIANAPEGERNNQLNKSAFALGTLVGAGEIDEEFVTNELTSAALGAQLLPAEVQRTIASGLRAGIRRPRTVAPPARPKAD